MSKQVFWPIALIIMGVLLLSSKLGVVPQDFWNLWPLLLIIVGLGGLLTSDRTEWMYEKKATAPRKAAPATKKKSTAKRKR